MRRKSKSPAQVRYLMSRGSPLTGMQKKRLQGELRRGAVKIRKKPRRRRRGY